MPDDPTPALLHASTQNVAKLLPPKRTFIVMRNEAGKHLLNSNAFVGRGHVQSHSNWRS